MSCAFGRQKELKKLEGCGAVVELERGYVCFRGRALLHSFGLNNLRINCIAIVYEMFDNVNYDLNYCYFYCN